MRTLVAVGVRALMALNNDEWQLDGGKQRAYQTGSNCRVQRLAHPGRPGQGKSAVAYAAAEMPNAEMLNALF